MSLDDRLVVDNTKKNQVVGDDDGDEAIALAATVSTTAVAGQGPRKNHDNMGLIRGEVSEEQSNAMKDSANSTTRCDNRSSKLSSLSLGDNNKNATTMVVATSSSSTSGLQPDESASLVSGTPTQSLVAVNREEGPAENRDFNDNNLNDKKANEIRPTSGHSSPGIVSTTSLTEKAEKEERIIADGDDSNTSTRNLDETDLSLPSGSNDDCKDEEGPSTSANIQVTESPKAQSDDFVLEENVKEMQTATVRYKIESSNAVVGVCESAEKQKSNCDIVQFVEIKVTGDGVKQANSLAGGCDKGDKERRTTDGEFKGGGERLTETDKPQIANKVLLDRVAGDSADSVGAKDETIEAASEPRDTSMVSQLPSSPVILLTVEKDAGESLSNTYCPTSPSIVEEQKVETNAVAHEKSKETTESLTNVQRNSSKNTEDPAHGFRSEGGVQQDNEMVLTKTPPGVTTIIGNVSKTSSLSSSQEEIKVGPGVIEDSKKIVEVNLPKLTLNIKFGSIRDGCVPLDVAVSGKVKSDNNGQPTTTMTVSEPPSDRLSNESPLQMESVSGSRSILALSSSPVVVPLAPPATAPHRPKLLANLKPKSPDTPEEDEEENGFDAKNLVSGSEIAPIFNHSRPPTIRSSVVVATVQYANSSSVTRSQEGATPPLEISKSIDSSSNTTYINKRSSLYVNSPDFSKKSTIVSPLTASLPSGSPFKTAPAAGAHVTPPLRPAQPPRPSLQQQIPSGSYPIPVADGPTTTMGIESRRSLAVNEIARESRAPVLQLRGGDQYGPSTSSQKVLSTLKMKTPDFSKLSSTPKSNQVPSTQNSSAHHYKTPAIDPNSFQEIRKKYNYISDLQLKPQSEPVPSNVTEPTTTTAGGPNMIPVNSDYRQQPPKALLPTGIRREDPAPSVSYPNLYVNTPDFTTQKFSNHGRAAIETSAAVTTPHHQPYHDAYDRVPPSGHSVSDRNEYQPKLYPITVQQEQHRVGYPKRGLYEVVAGTPPPLKHEQCVPPDRTIANYSQVPPHRHNYPPVKSKAESSGPLVDNNYNYALRGSAPMKIEGLPKSGDIDPMYAYHGESTSYSLPISISARYGSPSTQSTATQPPPLRYGEIGGPESNYQGSVIKSRSHEEGARQLGVETQPLPQRHDINKSIVASHQQPASVISLKQQQTDLLRTDLKRIHSPNQATSGSYMAPYPNAVGQMHPPQQQSPSNNHWPPIRSSSVAFVQPFPKSSSSSPIHMQQHSQQRMAPSPTTMMRSNLGSPAHQHPSGGGVVPSGGGNDKPAMDYYKRPTFQQRVGHLELTRPTPQHNSHQHVVVSEKYSSTGDLSRGTLNNLPPVNRYGSLDRLGYGRGESVEVNKEPTKGADDYNRQQRPTIDTDRGHYLAAAVPPARNDRQPALHVQMPLSNFPKFHLQGGNPVNALSTERNTSRSVNPSEVPVALVKTERTQPARPIVSNSAGPAASPSSSSSSTAPRLKRESPLDLSVKTVKTKADSTGGYYDNGLPVASMAGPKATNSLKVNYVPNFSQHQRGQLQPKDEPGHSRQQQGLPMTSTARSQPHAPSPAQMYYEQDSTYLNIGYPDSRHMTPPAQVHQMPFHPDSANKPPAGYPYVNSGPQQLQTPSPKNNLYGQNAPEIYSGAKMSHDIYPHQQQQNSHPSTQGHFQVAASGSHQPRYAEANYPHGRGAGGVSGHQLPHPVTDGGRPHQSNEIPRGDEPMLERKRHANFAHLSSGQQPASKTIKANDPYQSPIPNHYDAYKKQESLPPTAAQQHHHSSVSRGGHPYGGPHPTLLAQGYHPADNKYPQTGQNPSQYQMPPNAIMKKEQYSTSNYPPRPEIGLENRAPHHHVYQSQTVTRPESSRDNRPTQQPSIMNNNYPVDVNIQYPLVPSSAGGVHPGRLAPNNTSFPHHHQIHGYPKAMLQSSVVSEVSAYAKPLTMNVDLPMQGPPLSKICMVAQQHPCLESRQQMLPKSSGADRDVISKLKNTIEEKQHQRLIKKQTSVESSASPEDMCNKSDIASILAARIRTKGELKGYIAPPSAAQLGEHKLTSDVTHKQEAALAVNPKERFDPPSDMEGVSGFDLRDWGSACNDFVEQLKSGKKKSKRRKPRKSEELKLEFKREAPDEELVVLQPTPSVSIVPKEAIRDADKLTSMTKVANSDGSSDEDKPLVLIRQQSLHEKAKVTESDVNSRSSSVLTAGRIFDRATGAAIVKGVKEKRLLQEKRYAARLANASSSSESETENLKKPLKPFKRKKVALKSLSTLAARKANNRGSESSQKDEEEEDDQERRREKINAVDSPAMTTKTNEKLVSKKHRKRGKITESSDSELEDGNRMQPKKRLGAAIGKCKDKQSLQSVSHKAKPSGEDKQKKGAKKAISINTNEASSEESCESSEKVVTRKAITATLKKSKNAVAAKSLSDAENKARRSKESTTPTRTNKMRRNKSIDVGPKISSANKEPLKLKSKREEPMTRSKKKQEIAEQKANSLVLRNDKVIQSPSSRAATKVALKEKGGPKRKMSDSEKYKAMKGTKKIESKTAVASLSSSSEGGDEGEASDSSESAETAVSVRLRPRKAKDNEKEANVRRPRHLDGATVIADKKAILDSSSNKGGEVSFNKTESGMAVDDLEKRQIDKVAATPPQPAAARPPQSGKRGALKRQRQETVDKDHDPDLPGADDKSRTKKGRKAGGDQQKFDPGWEDQLYEFKRSLKVPDSLITIESPKWHRVSTSLPDLEPRSDSDEDEIDEDSNRGRIIDDEPATRKSSTLSSIIDLVHQRVIWPIRRLAQMGSSHETTMPVKKPLVGDKSNSLLLPTPVLVKTTRQMGDNQEVEDFEEVIIKNEFKKKSVKKSRTRKEYQVERNKEIIREIFGGEDRPASAPPGCAGRPKVLKSDEKAVQEVMNEYEAIVINKMTYEQKFEEYLGLYSTPEENCTVSNKSLQLAMSIDEAIKEDVMIFQRPIVQGEDPEHGGLVKRRLGKRAYTRRKGSSGFDYIRKKKRPTPVNTNAMLVPSQVAQLRTQMITFVKDRSEQDISKEIKCWVLNKGVGESVLHKATRMNLLDVVAYCLIRLEIAPDQKDNAGYTPLHEACSRGHFDIARLLLQHGANPGETSPSGIRPLHDAVENGDMEIVRLLLAYGADPQLATYAGQTPLDLAEDDEMEEFLSGHLYDLQYFGSDKKGWRFEGPWRSNYDPESGYNVLYGAPQPDDIDWPKRINRNKKKRKSSSDEFFKVVANESRASSLNLTVQKLSDELNGVKTATVKRTAPAVGNVSLVEPRETEAFGNSDDGELFEIEECENLLPPVYFLNDEGADKWCIWTDLQNLLKVKSKETLLKQICPPDGRKEELVREFKMNDFLQKATCLQLLCSGEKLNIRASKVSLIKYTDSVKALLGVNTLVMRL